MGSEKKLVKSRRSLIIDGLELIGRGLKTAMDAQLLYKSAQAQNNAATEMNRRGAIV